MNKQTGMTLPSMVVALALAGLLIKAAIALVPMFWDDRMLTTVLSKMEQNDQYSDLNAPDLADAVAALVQRNQLAIPTHDLSVRPIAGDALELSWEYERRATWIGNIDFVVKFQHHKEIN